MSFPAGTATRAGHVAAPRPRRRRCREANALRPYRRGRLAQATIPRRRPCLKGTQTPDWTSSSELVLMDEPTQHGARSNAGVLGRPRNRIRRRLWRLEIETSVGPVVVGGVAPKHT